MLYARGLCATRSTDEKSGARSLSESSTGRVATVPGNPMPRGRWAASPGWFKAIFFSVAFSFAPLIPAWVFLQDGAFMAAAAFGLLTVGIIVVYAAVTGPWFDALEDFIDGEALLSGRESMVVRADVMGRTGIGVAVIGYHGFHTTMVFFGSAMMAVAAAQLLFDGYLPGVSLVFMAAALFSLGLVLWRRGRTLRPQVQLIRRAGRQAARRHELIGEALALSHPDHVLPAQALNPATRRSDLPAPTSRIDPEPREGSPVLRFIAWLMMVAGGIGLLATLAVLATVFEELFGSITDPLELAFTVPAVLVPIAVCAGLVFGGRKLLTRQHSAIN